MFIRWKKKTEYHEYLVHHKSGYQIIQTFIQYQSLFFKAIGQNPSDEETQQLIMRVHLAKSLFVTEFMFLLKFVTNSICYSLIAMVLDP